MPVIRLIFISQAGNTRSFVNKLVAYAQTQPEAFTFEPVEITELTLDHAEKQPYFAFVPTYLDGGNGIDNGVKEILTTPLRDYLAYGDNRDHLLGVVGSGNKNFNAQYILTARRYAHDFKAPLIGDYELRGNERDVARIYKQLCSRLASSRRD